MKCVVEDVDACFVAFDCHELIFVPVLVSHPFVEKLESLEFRGFSAYVAYGDGFFRYE